MDAYRTESGIRASLATIAEASSAFGRRWSALKENLEGDPHIPDLQDIYIEPMLRSQTALIEAIDAMRRAAHRFQETSDESTLDEHAVREPSHPIVR